MDGVYVLILKISKEEEIMVGRLGKMNFKPGYYAYVGSALKGINKRIERHLRRDKKLHWHIDYLTLISKPIAILYSETQERFECKIAKKLSVNLEFLTGFGCSDCKCKSHLFYSEDKEDLINKTRKAFEELGLKVKVFLIKPSRFKD